MLRWLSGIIILFAWVGGIFTASWNYHAAQDRLKASIAEPLAAESWEFPSIIIPDPALAYNRIAQSKIWPQKQKTAVASAKKTTGDSAKRTTQPSKKPKKARKNQKKKKQAKPAVLKAITRIGKQAWAVFIIDKKRQRLQTGETLQEGQKIIEIGATWVDISDGNDTKRVKLFSRPTD